MCGGVVSIAMQVLIMYLIYTAVREMIFMEEPDISSFALPLSVEDRSEIAPVRLKDFDYVLAIKIYTFNYNT